MENNTMNTATQSPAQSQVSAPVSNNQGGAKKSSSILTIVFLITTLGFAGAFVWAMLRDTGSAKADKASSTACVVTEEEVAAAEEGSVAEVVANYDTEKEVKDVIDGLNAYLGTRRDTVSAPVLSVDSSRVLKEVESGKLYTRIKKSFGLTYMLNDLSLASTFSEAFDVYLGQQGFVKNPSLTNDYQVYYEKGDIRCEASALSNPVSIDCSNLNWLKDEDATLVKNLYNAYVASNGNVDDYLVIVADGSKIETSKNGKFETLQKTAISGLGPVGGFAGLFYREVGSDTWTFYKGTQAPLPCDGFTGDAREAFAGMTCVTNGGYDLGTVGGE